MLEPVRGMRDVLPAQQGALAEIERQLTTELAQWGYARLDLPILERRELYLKKAGEELVGKLYDFVFQGRALALRPEWTASVLRAYLSELQSEPLPLRLAYAGPVFRYERPQRATYRQFTQVGVELIGGASPLADAEVIALACRGLERVGVRQYTLRVGHIGVVRALLSGLGLAERTTNLLLWNMERLRGGHMDAIREQLAAADATELFDLGPLAALPDDQLESLLLTMLRAVGLQLENTTRQPEAIVARLVRKLRRVDPQPQVERALGLLGRLSAARGTPEATLAELEALFREEQLDPAPLRELRAILELLAANGCAAQLTVDAGLGRGLHYYTGLIFEIDAADGLQLCGGGRYDDLVASLGGHAVPAIGFAYGLERVAAAATARVPSPAPIVVVMAEGASSGAQSAVLAVAQQLRSRGYTAVVDVRGRSLAANLRDAARRGGVAVVTCDERAPATIRWHALADRSEQTMALDAVPEGARA